MSETYFLTYCGVPFFQGKRDARVNILSARCDRPRWRSNVCLLARGPAPPPYFYLARRAPGTYRGPGSWLRGYPGLLPPYFYLACHTPDTYRRPEALPPRGSRPTHGRGGYLGPYFYTYFACRGKPTSPHLKPS